MAGESQASKPRAASGRLITDMEMNSTYRGAVEIFNLCKNLRANDTLFAECIRTFSSCVINGRIWMYRLEASERSKDLQQFNVETYVPPTKKNHMFELSVANPMRWTSMAFDHCSTLGSYCRRTNFSWLGVRNP